MANQLGVNVDAKGTYGAADLKAAGVTWARVVALPEINLRFYFDDLHDHGIRVLLVLASESFHGTTWEEGCAEYAHRYEGRLDALQVGNEPDIASPSSWTMSSGDLNGLLGTARAAFPSTFIVGPGLASGDPGWAGMIDLSLIDAISCHPYGRRPVAENAPPWTETPGNFGYVGDLLDGYRKYGKPLWVTEVGLSTAEVTYHYQARYCYEMMRYLRSRQDVETALWFCWSDAMVPQFGLLSADGGEKPSLDAFAAVATEPLLEEQPEPAPRFVLGFERWAQTAPELLGQPQRNEMPVGPDWQVQPTSTGLLAWYKGRPAEHVLLARDGTVHRYYPGQQEPEPEPEPQPEPQPEPEPTPEMHFSPEQVAEVLGSPLQNVRANWPLVLRALSERGMADRPVQIAALATIGVECAVFRPIEEYRNPDGSIPDYWHNYGGGAAWHGRGLIQLTHKSNYAAYGNIIGVDLVGNPDLALDPWISALIFAAYFEHHRIQWEPKPHPLMNCADLARAGEWRGVRVAVNGGYNGWDHFLSLVQRLEAL